MHRNASEYHTVHADSDELGTHSIRKGAATYCCAGIHPGSPIVSVCLRAGWTIGRVKERYLKYEYAGDELVGRSLTGISPTSCEFSTSPVYFSSSANDECIKSFLGMTFSVHQDKNISLC